MRFWNAKPPPARTRSADAANVCAVPLIERRTPPGAGGSRADVAGSRERRVLGPDEVGRAASTPLHDGVQGVRSECS